MATVEPVEDQSELVHKVAAIFRDRKTERAIFDVPLHVAWMLKDKGCGLLERQNGGEGITVINGKNYSIKRVIFDNGHLFKLLIDSGVGGANTPEWADEGFLDLNGPDTFHPALNPATLESEPSPDPDPEPLPDNLEVRVKALETELLSLKSLLASNIDILTTRLINLEGTINTLVEHLGSLPDFNTLAKKGDSVQVHGKVSVSDVVNSHPLTWAGKIL